MYQNSCCVIQQHLCPADVQPGVWYQAHLVSKWNVALSIQ
jgi:hypothetical protein